MRFSGSKFFCGPAKRPSQRSLAEPGWHLVIACVWAAALVLVASLTAYALLAGLPMAWLLSRARICVSVFCCLAAPVIVASFLKSRLRFVALFGGFVAAAIVTGTALQRAGEETGPSLGPWEDLPPIEFDRERPPSREQRAIIVHLRFDRILPKIRSKGNPGVRA